MEKTTPYVMKMWPSFDGDSLVLLYYRNASEIWPEKRIDLMKEGLRYILRFLWQSSHLSNRMFIHIIYCLYTLSRHYYI